MSRHTVEESAVRDLALDREDRTCPECGQRMHVRCQYSDTGRAAAVERGASAVLP